MIDGLTITQSDELADATERVIRLVDALQEACSRLPRVEEIERRIAATERLIGLQDERRWM
ncbi:MAG TPA: hypothetical protein VK793_03770 [Steroidobacteraceae bacterium]|jgi:hypothetical protein|nr:hypothetical protein [Steroidobacteraceae bacterium]